MEFSENAFIISTGVWNCYDIDGLFLKFELDIKCLKFKYFLTKTVLYEGFKWDFFC